MLLLRSSGLLTFMLVWVSIRAEALAVGTASHALAQNRVTRTLFWGLIKPFRSASMSAVTATTTTTTTTTTSSTSSPRPYNLGIQSSARTKRRHVATQAAMSGAVAADAAQIYPTPNTGIYDEALSTRGGRQVLRVRKRRSAPARLRRHADASCSSLADPLVDSSSQEPSQCHSMVGSLIDPFGAALEASSGDIRLPDLLQACQKYRDAMYALYPKAMENLSQNLEKIETATRQVPLHSRTTLRSLLEHEKTIVGVQGKNGKLDESSAALSLLWLRRSIAFQCRLNESLVDEPYLSPVEAAVHAYELELEPYHSWGLRKVCKMALRTSTIPREKTLAQMRGSPLDRLDKEEERVTMQEIKQLSETWKPLLNEWKRTFESLGLEDDSPA